MRSRTWEWTVLVVLLLMGDGGARARAQGDGIGLETEYFNGQSGVQTRPDRVLNRYAEQTGGGYFDLKRRVAVVNLAPHRARRTSAGGTRGRPRPWPAQ
jgi:hypothetical protein